MRERNLKGTTACATNGVTPTVCSRQKHEHEHGIYREWLGLKELSRYADVSERTLRGWIHSPADPLPAAKVCGKVLVRRSDFDAYLQRHRIRTLEELNVDGIVRDVLQEAAHGS